MAFRHISGSTSTFGADDSLTSVGVVCNEARAVSSRPFGDAGHGDLPPEGMWASAKGDRSYVWVSSSVLAPPDHTQYVYDLAHVDDQAATELESL